MKRVIKNIGYFFYGIWVVGSMTPKGERSFDAILNALKTQFDERFAHMDNQLQHTNEAIQQTKTNLRSSETSYLFSTVGRALTSWSQMEQCLVLIAAHLLRTKSDKAGILMYSIQNPRPWIAAIHDLFDMDEMLREFQGRFDKISDRIGRLIDTRNRLAHHSVNMNEVKIEVPLSDARNKSRKQKPLSIQEVSSFTDLVLDITDDLNKLLNEIGDLRESAKERLP